MTEDERAELAEIIAGSVRDFLEMVGRGEAAPDITWLGAGKLAAERLQSADFYYLPRVLKKEANG